MVLTVDVGNSLIKLGGFCRDELTFVAHMATVMGTEDEYAGKILSILGLHGVQKQQIEGVILSSVVPTLTASLQKAAALLCPDGPRLLVGPGMKTGLNIHCDVPSSVGTDIICACVGAHYRYGSPAIVVDMGTATTWMVLDDKGTFIGAAIAPGVATGMQALSEKAAQLPQVGLEAPKSAVAKNTADCMRAGAIYGSAAMVDGMIARIFEQLGYEVPVYVTGSMAGIILDHCRTPLTYDADLVLRGLYRLYLKNT